MKWGDPKMTALTSLRFAPCSEIADITPLQNLTALTALGLLGNQIADIRKY